LEDLVHQRALVALAALGDCALEPCIAAYAPADDESLRTDLACALAMLGVRDDRIYRILVEQFEVDLSTGPCLQDTAIHVR
jgi:hypothetical protein